MIKWKRAEGFTDFDFCLKKYIIPFRKTNTYQTFLLLFCTRLLNGSQLQKPFWCVIILIMNGQQLIPPLTPEMISREPDQTSFILNQVITAVNELRQQNP